MDVEKLIIPKNPVIRERLEVLRVPLDVMIPEHLPNLIYELLSAREGKNLALVSVWDVLRARRNKEYRAFILSASLVIPISKSLVNGARFLTGREPVRYMPFDFVVNLLTALEERELTVYLLGGKLRILKKAEKNIRQTFPRLQIVGRCAGSFKKSEEGAILEAIRKASPALLLVGKGVSGKEHWIARNDRNLPRGLRLWCSDLYEIFAEQKRHPSSPVFERGLEWIGYCFENPLRFFRFFSFIRYQLLLLLYRLFRKEKPPPAAEAQKRHAESL
ncbi:MAG: WecB/TagA/CpsF family glycosyltransferase [Spirochaetaceae bacterium]|jgi:N-acetylglucosaminyldiphosphoundecaprenol N-acetyl-beta-D-mannosaminyltransferase|nr:WecB/TagA/CpsF family glycosyltransferase [Spirochaetaceae bacterium]